MDKSLLAQAYNMPYYEKLSEVPVFSPEELSQQNSYIYEGHDFYRRKTERKIVDTKPAENRQKEINEALREGLLASDYNPEDLKELETLEGFQVKEEHIHAAIDFIITNAAKQYSISRPENYRGYRSDFSLMAFIALQIYEKLSPQIELYYEYERVYYKEILTELVIDHLDVENVLRGFKSARHRELFVELLWDKENVSKFTEKDRILTRSFSLYMRKLVLAIAKTALKMAQGMEIQDILDEPDKYERKRTKLTLPTGERLSVREA